MPWPIDDLMEGADGTIWAATPWGHYSSRRRIRFYSDKSIKLMTSKYTNGYPDPHEPGTFPDLAGYYFGFTFCVLEDPEVDGTGAGKGTFGWSGYHNTHFWIDPENKVYGLFMSRAIEFNFSILSGLKKAVYTKLSEN